MSPPSGPAFLKGFFFLHRRQTPRLVGPWAAGMIQWWGEHFFWEIVIFTYTSNRLDQDDVRRDRLDLCQCQAERLGHRLAQFLPEVLVNRHVEELGA